MANGARSSVETDLLVNHPFDRCSNARVDDGLKRVRDRAGSSKTRSASFAAVNLAHQSRTRRGPNRSAEYQCAAGAPPARTTSCAIAVSVDGWDRRVRRRTGPKDVRLAGCDPARQSDSYAASQGAREAAEAMQAADHAGASSAILRWSDSLFDEGVPLVTLGALPKELGAAIPAPHADVRVEVEERRRGSGSRTGAQALSRTPAS